jgi:hypothetical protein
VCACCQNVIDDCKLNRHWFEGDLRGSIVALRKVRECLESLGEMLSKADEVSGGSSSTLRCSAMMKSGRLRFLVKAASRNLEQPK